MMLVVLLGALVLLATGMVLGVWLVGNWARVERERLAAREAALNATWLSLQAANRINRAFWLARDALRREAERQGRE